MELQERADYDYDRMKIRVTRIDSTVVEFKRCQVLDNTLYGYPKASGDPVAIPLDEVLLVEQKVRKNSVLTKTCYGLVGG